VASPAEPNLAAPQAEWPLRGMAQDRPAPAPQKTLGEREGLAPRIFLFHFNAPAKGAIVPSDGNAGTPINRITNG